MMQFTVNSKEQNVTAYSLIQLPGGSDCLAGERCNVFTKFHPILNISDAFVSRCELF